jgi:hypothetical protein
MREDEWVPRSTRRVIRRLGPYGLVVDQLDLHGALLTGLGHNGLLPPRSDDRAGGEVEDRLSAAIKLYLVNGIYEPDRAVLVPLPKAEVRDTSSRSSQACRVSDRTHSSSAS